MTDDELPPDALCEICYHRCLPGEKVFRYAHIVGSNLRGDTEWIYTYSHQNSETGCVRRSASIWD